MDDGQSKEIKKSLHQILKEKYDDLNQMSDVDDLSKIDTKPLYKRLRDIVAEQIAYDIIGPIKTSYDGANWDLPDRTIFHINHHKDNIRLWSFIREHESHVHYVDDRNDKFYFDDADIAVMLKLML